MARDSTFAEDLDALAEDERSRLGEPPTAEELIAYRDGKLTEEGAERVRDRLAVDPELASIYLDLQSDPPALAADAPAGADVDEAWRTLSARLGRPTVVPFHRRPAGRVLLALAAAAVGVLGLLLIPKEPAGDYFVVEATGAAYRGGTLTVPWSAAGLEFHVDASALTGKVVVELRDALGGLIRKQTFPSGRIVFRVPASKLEEDRTYLLTVRPSGAPEGAPAAIEEIFTLAFEE